MLRALVVPVSDEEFGQRPVAFIEVDAGQKLDEDGYNRFLSDRLPSYKLPVKYHPWPTHLEEVTLKLSRKTVTEHAETL